MRDFKTMNSLKDWQPEDFVDYKFGKHIVTREQTAFSRHSSGIDFLIKEMYRKYCGMKEDIIYDFQTGLITKIYTPI